MENLCATKNTRKKVNRQPKEGKNICKSYIYLIRNFDVDYIKDFCNSILQDK